MTDITYIRTHEGWLYLAVVLDLFSRQVVGWSMQPRIDRELAIGALLMAVWRRRPTGEVLVHSDQGSQFSSYDWQDFLKEHKLKPSMSRRGNCHDNAVAESFFQLLKRERIRRKTYPDRATARRDVFDYIEIFYNPKRRHGNNDRLFSPVEFERRYFNTLASVEEFGVDSNPGRFTATTKCVLILGKSHSRHDHRAQAARQWNGIDHAGSARGG